ncbi:MAG TPA: flagellar type III secretion system pore protein FliP [Acidobacteriaceae bacterium]|nr:flagellar type III secretion system pore protein FliP [Acidobacteriaceae bacterium]
MVAILLLLGTRAWGQGAQGQGGSTQPAVAQQAFWANRTPQALAKAAQGRPAPVTKRVAGHVVGVVSKKPSAAIAAATPAPMGLDTIADQMKSQQSVPWSIVLGLTLLTLLPALLLSMTPMVRLLVVFHFLRQALGTQTAPSNQVLMGLGLMMTWFLMQPVMLQVDNQAIAPYRAGTITGEQAMELGSAPVKTYMLRYAREKDLALFASAGMGTRPKTVQELPLQVVVPAYMLSELKAGFQIGAVLFLPFLLIDLAIASITTSVGMMQLPPVVISTPVKILLFVMVDGWNLLAGSLLKSF